MHEVAILVSLRIWFTVGSDKSVTVEVMVRSGIASVIAAVCKYLLAVLVETAKTLVNKIPYITALIIGNLAD